MYKVSKYSCFLFSLATLTFGCGRNAYVLKTDSYNNYDNSSSIITAQKDTLYKERKLSEAPVLLEKYYKKAFYELQAMLCDQQALSFRRAVFITENAYFENRLDYTDFSYSVSHLSSIAAQWAHVNHLKGYNYSDSLNTALNGAIFHVLTDTTYDINGQIISVPYSYDFNDCFARKQWANMFVSKLLCTHKGNCHSLPFLYKMMAEELNVNVWLSFTPNHIYLRNRCKKTGWYNTELTNAMFPNEAWIMASGYVSVNSIVSGMYMDTLSIKQSIVICLNDLAKGYERKINNADPQFILNCCNLGLKYYPNYGELVLQKAETLKKMYENEIFLHGLNASQEEQHAEKIKQLLFEMNEAYGTLAKLDYREIPEAMFSEWMTSLKNNQEKYENKNISTTFKTAQQ